MKITISPTVGPATGQPADTVHSAISVEHPYDELNAAEAIQLMKQALIAWGYAEANLNEHLEEE